MAAAGTAIESPMDVVMPSSASPAAAPPSPTFSLNGTEFSMFCVSFCFRGGSRFVMPLRQIRRWQAHWDVPGQMAGVCFEQFYS